jgi:cytochrome c biogenesis factor
MTYIMYALTRKPHFLTIDYRSVIISYLWFAYSFLKSNYKVVEVFQYSSSILGWSEKLYASWASNAGSWLFFSFSFALGYLIIRMKLGEEQEQSKMYQYMDVILLFMVVVVIIQNPFKILSYTPNEGLGHGSLRAWVHIQ